MSDPKFISSFEGFHNTDLENANQRLKKGRQYENLSTIMVVPSRDSIHPRVVESWLNLQSPMNNPFIRIFVVGSEVGEAYSAAIEQVLAHPQLKDYRYLLTVETDNMPPFDGLLKLYESICKCKVPCKDHFSVVAGLYWTKGEAGQPMIYGDPKALLGFQPQMVEVDAVQECNGTGMGFTLYHMGLFKDKKVPRPWFTTRQGAEGMGTQDLYFAANIRQLGYRVASDNRVRVGHYDAGEDRVW